MGRLRNGCEFLGLISSRLGTMVSDQRHPRGEPSGAGPCLSPVRLKSFVVYMLPKRSSICALKTFRSRPPTDRARMSVQPNERIPDQTTHRSPNTPLCRTPRLERAPMYEPDRPFSPKAAHHRVSFAFRWYASKVPYHLSVYARHRRGIGHTDSIQL